MSAEAAGEDANLAVDRHVGARLRALRRARGLSQGELARELGITFQQVQKYEKGTNRISASKLYAAGVLLDARISDFFHGLPQATGGDRGDQVLIQSLMHEPELASAVTALLRLGRGRRQLLLDTIGELSKPE